MDVYPQYQLPAGGWTSDKEHADELWARHNEGRPGPGCQVPGVCELHPNAHKIRRPLVHEHTYQGQKLRHDHPGGDRPHGYYEHPEDGSRATLASGTPVADALAEVDKAQSWTGCDCAAPSELEALRELAEAVRASLAAFSEGDVRALAETANDLGGGTAYLPTEQERVMHKAQALYGLTPGLPAPVVP